MLDLTSGLSLGLAGIEMSIERNLFVVWLVGVLAFYETRTHCLGLANLELAI